MILAGATGTDKGVQQGRPWAALLHMETTLAPNSAEHKKTGVNRRRFLTQLKRCYFRAASFRALASAITVSATALGQGR